MNWLTSNFYIIVALQWSKSTGIDFKGEKCHAVKFYVPLKEVDQQHLLDSLQVFKANIDIRELSENK
jgi:hypothetical protein